MSQIDDLIAEHCPEGVEFRELGDCITKNTGGGTPSRSNQSYWDGDIPWASVGDLSIPRNFIYTTRASNSTGQARRLLRTVFWIGLILVKQEQPTSPPAQQPFNFPRGVDKQQLTLL
jgi:hypothetical protein